MEIKLGAGKVTIEVEANLENPELTSTGKSYLLASTKGWTQTSEKYKGKSVSVSLNVIAPK